jgi:type IV pilus assembly protein PilW
MKSSCFFRQKGMTLIELMVAVVIGLLAMYAVYRVYEGTERVKRNVASVGDAQIAGMYSIFLLEQYIHNAGSGIMFNGEMLAPCVPGDAGGNVGGGGAPVGRTLSLRPLPVVIEPNLALSGVGGMFDDVYVFSGDSSNHLVPAIVQTPGATSVVVAASHGFRVGDVLVDVLAPPLPPRAQGTLPPPPPLANRACQAYLINNAPDPSVVTCDTATPPTTPCTVELSLQGTGVPATGNALFNLGTAVRYHFFVNGDNTLLLEEWRLNTGGTWDRVGAAPSPIISGVMSFRVQYGIGTTTDALNLSNNPVIGPVTAWVYANAVPTGPWGITDVQGLPWNDAVGLPSIRQIKAVRLSIIVQADEPEFDPAVAATLPTTFTHFANCTPGTTCPTGMAANPPVTLQTGNRYRMYETVIPLKNAIWN